MITLHHETTRITCTEENAPVYRAIIDSGKPRKFKRETDHAIKRDYPVFKPGMTTGEYVALFQSLNSRLQLTAHEFIHADRAAPMLDATQPEVLEEIDPDYIEPVTQPKRKAPTAAQYRKACLDALDYLKRGDTDTAQCVLSEVLR